MIDIKTAPSLVRKSFDESVETLTSELRLAIDFQSPCILMAVHGSEYVCVDAMSALENCLIDEGEKVVRLNVSDLYREDLVSLNRQLDSASHVVFFVDGLNQDFSESRRIYSLLNHHGYVFFDQAARVVFWLTENELVDLAKHAPDFWVTRQCIVGFHDSPRPEQVLQNALESTWQGIGEYCESFEDTDAKISLRESMLVDLPKNNEATGVRANLLLTLGVLNWRKGNYEEAHRLLIDALKHAGKMEDHWFEAECFNALALVNSSTGRIDEAIDAYKQAIKLAPNQIFAWNNLGNLSLKIDRNDEAMIAFQKAIDHNPQDTIAWIGLGDVFYRRDYVDEAIAAYRKATEYSPALHHPWLGLGNVYASIGQNAAAISAYQKAISLNKDFIPAWLRLGALFGEQDHYWEAIKAYQQALSINAKDCSIWNELGMIYLKAEKYGEAEEAFLKAIDLDRSFAWAYNNLASVYTHNARQKESIPLHLKSIELFKEDGDKAAAWDRLAIIYRRLNDYDNAVAAYQQADLLLPIKVDDFQEPDSNDPQVDPVSAADPALETDSSDPVEGSVDNDPFEPNKIRSGPDSEEEEEVPSWIFQSWQPSYGEPQISGQPRPDMTRMGMATAFFNTQVFTNETITQEIGYSAMQIVSPLFSVGISDTKSAPFGLDRDFAAGPPRTDSTTARVWNEKGNAHFRDGAYEEAMDAYVKAIQEDPGFGWPQCNLGVTCFVLGRFGEAVLLLQGSIDLLTSDGDRSLAWNELGNLYRCRNDYHNAVAAYQKADELDPENTSLRDTVMHFQSEPGTQSARIWNELGDRFFNSGSYREATGCFEKAIEIEPLNGLAYSNMGLCLTYQGKFKDAIPLYLNSLELLRDEKEKAVSWNRLGNVYRRLNDYDKAIAAYQEAVKLNNEQVTLVTRARFSLLGNCSID